MTSGALCAGLLLRMADAAAKEGIMEFSHVGIVTDKPKEGEVFVDATRVWITDFTKHPFRVEWLRFDRVDRGPKTP